jgi:hypothetical protein
VGNELDVSSLRIFGCKAFVHVPEKHRPKLAARSLICTFLGYTRNWKAYKLLNRLTRRLVESRDIVLNEGGPEKRYERIVIEDDADGIDAEGTPETGVPQRAPDQAVDSKPEPEPEPESESEIEDIPTSTPQPSITTSRPKRTIREPVPNDDPRYSVTSYKLRKRPAEHPSVAPADALTNPRTPAEAMAYPDAAQWEAACNDERRAFEHMGVYEIVPRPSGRKVVGSKWVFCIKHGPDGSIQKYKTRGVAQGFSEIEGIDYDKTFAPITKFASL